MSAADIAFGAPCGATPGNAAGCPTGAPGGGGAWYAVGGGGRRRRLGGQRAGHDRLMRLVSFVTGGPGRGHRSYAYSALSWICESSQKNMRSWLYWGVQRSRRLRALSLARYVNK